MLLNFCIILKCLSNLYQHQSRATSVVSGQANGHILLSNFFFQVIWLIGDGLIIIFLVNLIHFLSRLLHHLRLNEGSLRRCDRIHFQRKLNIMTFVLVPSVMFDIDADIVKGWEQLALVSWWHHLKKLITIHIVDFSESNELVTTEFLPDCGKQDVTDFFRLLVGLNRGHQYLRNFFIWRILIFNESAKINYDLNSLDGLWDSWVIDWNFDLDRLPGLEAWLFNFSTDHRVVISSDTHEAFGNWDYNFLFLHGFLTFWRSHDVISYHQGSHCVELGKSFLYWQPVIVL